MKLRIKDIVELKNIKTDDHAKPYIGLENIESWNSRFIPTESVSEGINNEYSKDDIIFGKLRPYLAKAYIAPNTGVCSTEFFVLHTKKGYYNKYLLYRLLTPAFIGYISSKVAGVKMPRTTWADFSSISFDLPSLEVQQRIVSYLDDKTAKIDHAVSLLQKKRDAYTRLKASIINRAVTRGLNPNVKLKDSGVDWIGMIPENWEVRRIKDVGFMKSGDVIRKEQLEDDGKYCVYGANSLIGHSNMFNVNGNVLTIGRVGSCGVVRQIVEPTFISDNALILYNIRGCINYMFFTLKSAKLERLNESIAQPLITATKVKGVFIPYPPLPEQQTIASFLDTHCSRIDHAISIVDKQIDAYTRLKKSLINEVVTGKRKV